MGVFYGITSGFIVRSKVGTDLFPSVVYNESKRKQNNTLSVKNIQTGDPCSQKRDELTYYYDTTAKSSRQKRNYVSKHIQRKRPYVLTHV